MTRLARPLLFRGATLLPGGADWAPRAPIDLLVAGGRVAAIGAALEVTEAEEIGAHHLLLLPAFVNAHTHSPEALARGRAPMARLDEWLAAEYADGQDALPEARIRQAILVSAAEAIRGGAVQVTDHFRQIPPNVESVAIAAAAWAEGGIRGRIAMMLRDLPSPSASFTPPSTETALTVAEALVKAPPKGAEIGLGPSAPQRCSDALLSGLGALARQHGALLHLHLCETAKDAADCRTRFGTDPVAHLQALGLTGSHAEFAHCVHLTDAELDRMAATGTLMVHNPLANLRLGSGIAPVARALARGVRLAIGSDGPGSNDTQDMLEAAKFALLLPRAGRPDAEWPTPAQVLAMATGGAVLAPGARADLLAFDLRAAAFTAAKAEELAPRLLMAARPRDLKHVMADGAFLMRDGALLPPALAACA
ncbi:amidohydrolase family protein [Falsiroseomonas tokyonensis]|uniref:Amidohydrolase family protein n=1 Tax=Falsiroseomonas tokyonensis TaxID=430521 RepID=A0ABV7BQE2_9PROT|nr:amidohydrolase family protein [Falsiroseomonas tokyonensis]MBU8536786.1 amidohydrolase family protein [Falsiroseomonas tokyonensis]